MSYGIIYALTSPSGKIYIGQTVQRFSFRWNSHRYSASNGKQGPLYASMRKHATDLWKREVVAECDTREELDQMEIMFISAFGDLNIHRGGSRERPDRTVGQKIANANRGRKRTPEQCARIRAGKLANPITDEGRASVSRAQKGRPCSAETRAKLSKSCKGRPWSDARRAAYESRRRSV